MNSIQHSCQSVYEQAKTHIVTEGQKVINEAKSLAERAGSSLIQGTIERAKKYGPILREQYQKFIAVTKKVLKVSLYVGVALALFSTNTTFFLLGAAAAIVFPEQARSAVNRISDVWQSLPWPAQALLLAPLPFAWPSYFVIAAPFVGADVCLRLQDRAGVPRNPPLSTETSSTTATTVDGTP